jgi:PAS domain S-box-containing protein
VWRFGDAIFDAVTEGIVIVGRDGRIVRANRRAEEMFGYGPGVLEGDALEVLLPDRLRTCHAEHLAGFFAAPRQRRMGMGLELAGRRANGVEFPIEVSLGFVHTDEGEFGLAFVTDITERRALEQTARQTEKFAALATLSAGIAHELNNPLSIISSRLELMLSEPGSPQPLSPQLAEDLHVVHRHVQRVSQIAQSLLSFARQTPRERRPIDLNAVVEETLVLMGKQLSKRGIAIVTNLSADSPKVIGDANGVEQVLMNLLLNARDAMPNGGEVRIETVAAPDPPGWVRLVVADTGHGIPPEVLPKVAEAFFTTKPTGTGMGLAVSYTIIREHGGTVAVESEPKRGTRFTISLPSIERGPAG